MGAAFVLGGAAGVGQELAMGVADRGASVAVIDRAHLVAGVEGAIACSFEAVDVVHEAFARARCRVGTPNLVVHALAAREGPAAGPLAAMTEAEWDEGCEAVLRAAMFCCAATYAMWRDGHGRLVFVLPLAGVLGGLGRTAQSAALDGIRGMAKTAARRWGDAGITVNCVVTTAGDELPSAASRWMPVLGPVEARTEVAGIIGLLASDDGRALTGATLVVDGGVVMVP